MDACMCINQIAGDHKSMCVLIQPTISFPSKQIILSQQRKKSANNFRKWSYRFYLSLFFFSALQIEKYMVKNEIHV